MKFGPLISADELTSLTGVVICDIRWDLTDPASARRRYAEAHIPGAVFVDLDRDLAGPPGLGGRHPLPEPEAFKSTLARLGIAPSSKVVVYDDVGGRYAARLWWMLVSIGHDAVALLDGGLQAWTRVGHPVESGEVTSELASYDRPIVFEGVVTHDNIADRELIDARAPERYRGDLEPVDSAPGHIPGSINIPTDANLDRNDRFLGPEALDRIYPRFENPPVVACGSGVTACHDALAMVLAGRDMPDIYVGSYSEWSGLGLPVNRGPNP